MMMPARYSGRPFWDVFLNETPPLWKARIDLARCFGFDLTFGCNGVEGDAPGVSGETDILERGEDSWVVKESTQTPHGDLVRIMQYPRDKSPWTLKPIITDPEREIDALLSTLEDPATCRLASWYPDLQQELGDIGCVFGIMSVPLAWWLYQRVNLEQGLMDFYDRTPLVERALTAYGETLSATINTNNSVLNINLALTGISTILTLSAAGTFAINGSITAATSNASVILSVLFNGVTVWTLPFPFRSGDSFWTGSGTRRIALNGNVNVTVQALITTASNNAVIVNPDADLITNFASLEARYY
jgi:hypothetical protein